MSSLEKLSFMDKHGIDISIVRSALLTSHISEAV